MTCSTVPHYPDKLPADFWQRVIDSIDLPVVVANSQTGSIVAANRRAVEFCQPGSAELVISTVAELITTLGWKVPTDLDQSLHQAAAGISQHLELQEVPEHKDASAHPHLHLTARGLGDGTANVVVTLGTAASLTDPSGGSERTLATLMANLPGIAYRSRSDEFWAMQFVSEGSLQLTGYSTAELTGAVSYAELIAITDRPRVVRELVRALEARRPYQLVYRISCKTSALKWVWECGRGVYDRTGKLLYLEGVVTDITERKQTENKFRRLNEHLEKRVQRRTAELEKANHELEAFVYTVSHDLRAPLRAVEGFAAMLNRRFADLLPAEAHEYLQIITSNVQHMNQQIADLRLFSRLGQQALRRQLVIMPELIDEALQELGPEMAQRQIDWQINQLPACHADRALLRQVWVNLLSNALKYTRQRQCATICIDGTTNASGETVYSVRDNGVGFDMAQVDKIFAVFKRLHSAQEYEGTGAGLAIVERIIKRHGGRVWAESRLEQGACFSFTLGEL